MSNQSISLTQNQKTSRLVWKVCVVTLCRIVLSSAQRFAYPFAPALSRGLGVPLTAITTIIAVNRSTAVTGMFFGPVADRLGYRLMMLTGLVVLVAGMFAGGFFPFYGVILASLSLAGLGNSIFEPVSQAYAGERVPFHRRGLVIGVLELSWAGSMLIGIPLLGLIIEYLGWRAPFFALGALGLIGIAALQLVIAKDGKRTVMHQTANIFSAWRKLVKERAALGAIGFAFFICAANDNLFVIYGAWLETSFNLGIVALGFSTTVIGMAELSGAALTAAVSDRLGLKRSVIAGLSLCIISYIVLPLMGKTLPLALGGLFFVFLTFEFTVVSALSLCTEFMPGLRATMMSSFLATAGIGRVIGVLIGGPAWLTGGIFVTALVSAVISCLGLASLVLGLRKWKKAGEK